MKFPATREKIKASGYRFEFARPCKRCNVNLEFYCTPAGKLAPLESALIDREWVMLSHFSTCPFADEFKKPEATKAEEEKQLGLFGEAV